MPVRMSAQPTSSKGTKRLPLKWIKKSKKCIKCFKKKKPIARRTLAEHSETFKKKKTKKKEIVEIKSKEILVKKGNLKAQRVM